MLMKRRWDRDNDNRYNEQPLDDQRRFTDNYNNYNERRGRWNNNEDRRNDYTDRSGNRPYDSNDNWRTTETQYFSNREEYPGPGRLQGFGRQRHDYGDLGSSSFHRNTTSREQQ